MKALKRRLDEAEEEVSRERAQKRKTQRELEDTLQDNEAKEREITNLKNKIRSVEKVFVSHHWGKSVFHSLSLFCLFLPSLSLAGNMRMIVIMPTCSRTKRKGTRMLMMPEPLTPFLRVLFNFVCVLCGVCVFSFRC